MASNTSALPKFHLFMQLAPELRQRIYALALTCDHPIQPHLCDNTLKFHDDNQQPHDAINALLGVTKASKKLRSESLPVFYSANTFQVGSDTVTYFDRLEHLGRFHMIRNVQFGIIMRKEADAAVILRGMNQYINTADAFEKGLLAAHYAKEKAELTHWQDEKEEYEQDLANEEEQIATGEVVGTRVNTSHIRYLQHKIQLCENMASDIAARLDETSVTPPRLGSLIGETFETLTEHPQYQAGGIEELNTLIALRKLTSAVTPPTSSTNNAHANDNQDRDQVYTSTLVLPFPSATSFASFPSLKWFPTVCYGLGIHMHIVENIPLDHVGKGIVLVTWRQKWQKKEFGTGSSMLGSALDLSVLAQEQHYPQYRHHQQQQQTPVYSRTLEMFPNLENMARPVRNTYYRGNCERSEIRWFSVETEGGGIWG